MATFPGLLRIGYVKLQVMTGRLGLSSAKLESDAIRYFELTKRRHVGAARRSRKLKLTLLPSNSRNMVNT